MVKCREATDKELASINPYILPETIQNGIAPAMGHASNQTFWGSDRPSTISESIVKFIGKKEPPVEHQEAVDIQTKAKMLKVNARQLIATLRGGHGIGTHPDYPEDVRGPMPQETIGYTDGSVKNPSSGMWHVAGFGMFWPAPLDK